jgi:hypothetical protein
MRRKKDLPPHIYPKFKKAPGLDTPGGRVWAGRVCTHGVTGKLLTPAEGDVLNVLISFIRFSQLHPKPGQRNDQTFVGNPTIIWHTKLSKATVSRCLLRLEKVHQLIKREDRDDDSGRSRSKTTTILWSAILAGDRAVYKKRPVPTPEEEAKRAAETDAAVDPLPDNIADPPDDIPKPPKKPVEPSITEDDLFIRGFILQQLLVNWPEHKSLLDKTWTNDNLAVVAKNAGGWKSLWRVIQLILTRKTEADTRFWKKVKADEPLDNVINVFGARIRRHMDLYREDVANEDRWNEDWSYREPTPEDRGDQDNLHYSDERVPQEEPEEPVEEKPKKGRHGDPLRSTDC